MHVLGETKKCKRIEQCRQRETCVHVVYPTVSSHKQQNVRKVSIVHNEPTVEQRRSMSEITNRRIHSLAGEALAHNSFIPNDEINFSELLSKLGVCFDSRRAVLFGR